MCENSGTPPASYCDIYDLTQSGQLLLYHIVAPPRSSSTALERALSNSPDIDAQINDPWSLYDENREAQTYDFLARRIAELRARKAGTPLRILIKSIADYIAPGEQWDRMTGISAYTVFLIRQPLLSTESMMRMMVREATPDDAYAQHRGYWDWQDMVATVDRARDYRDYEELYRSLFLNEQPIHSRPEMQIPVLEFTPATVWADLGFTTADHYAAFKGYPSWRELLAQLTDNTALLAAHTDLLEANFRCRILGWTALQQHYRRMTPGSRFGVIDATVYRALPERVLVSMLTEMGLTASPEVLSWQVAGKSFETDYDGTVPYYDRVLHSTEVQPPTENPVTIDRFPGFVADAIDSADGFFTIYRNLLSDAVSRLSIEDTVALVDWRWDGRSIQDVDPMFWTLFQQARRGTRAVTSVARHGVS
jgi:hypothetical protein